MPFGSGGRRCDRAMAWRYTAMVMAWARRLTALASVVVLSGSPVVLSACLAVCLEDMTPTASRVTSSNRHGHAAKAEHAAVAQHQHHHRDVEPVTVVRGQSGRPNESAPRLAALCGSCCTGLELAFMTGPRAERTDLVALGMASTAVLLTWSAPATSDRTSSFSDPPVTPLPPISAPVPLRI
jgi:hypothetical protein